MHHEMKWKKGSLDVSKNFFYYSVHWFLTFEIMMLDKVEFFSIELLFCHSSFIFSEEIYCFFSWQKESAATLEKNFQGALKSFEHNDISKQCEHWFGGGMLPACCRYAASMLRACYQHVASILLPCCKHVTRTFNQFWQLPLPPPK